MILPYVYRLIHKETGQYYFGYRSKNVSLGIQSVDDLGVKYFTSAKLIRKNFSDYNYEVLAEFFNKDDAYDFEQELIREHWGNPMLLNKHYHSEDKARWKNDGHSEETKKKMKGLKRSPEFSEYRSKVMKGKVPWNKGLTKETDSRMAAIAKHRAEVGNNHLIGTKRPPEFAEKIKKALTGYKHSEETRKKMSEGKRKMIKNKITISDQILTLRNKRYEIICKTSLSESPPKPLPYDDTSFIDIPDGEYTTDDMFVPNDNQDFIIIGVSNSQKQWGNIAIKPI